MPGAGRTLLFYAHYDGQPVDAKGWKQGSPFTPIMRDRRMEDSGQEIANFLSLTSFPPDARLYARSASDDKAPIMALLAAVDALSALNQQPTSNVKVILDGEEEARSPSLAATMGRYRDRYRADLMLILDGPVAPERQTDVELRRSRQPRVSADCVRSQVRSAQRPLRELGAQPGDGSRSAPCVDERRERARARQPAFTTTCRR